MSLATSPRPIGLFLPDLPGMACQGYSYDLLALQITARSDLTLSITTVPDMRVMRRHCGRYGQRRCGFLFDYLYLGPARVTL